MFRLLFGAAFLRWIERLGAPEQAEPSVDRGAPKPAPAIEVQQPLVRSHPAEMGSDDPGAQTVYPRVQRAAMGSMFEVYLAGTDRGSLEGAAEVALNEIEHLDRQLSHYKETSDITRLNAHASEQWVRVEPRLYDLLKRCADLSALTGGAFDITAGPLVRAWGFHDGNHRVPPDDEIAALLERTGMSRIAFDDDDHLVHFTAPGMEINLGAIGKGYALDEAAESLRFYSVGSAVIHGGQSTIYALGAPPGEPGWPFTVKDPRDRTTPIEEVLLRDQALSTSAGYEQCFQADGVTYSHIIDPRTGRPANGVLSVSVIAANAADSDALSTAFFVLGPDRTRALCKSLDGVRVIMTEDGPDDGITVHRFGFDPPAPT